MSLRQKIETAVEEWRGMPGFMASNTRTVVEALEAMLASPPPPNLLPLEEILRELKCESEDALHRGDTHSAKIFMHAWEALQL